MRQSRHTRNSAVPFVCIAMRKARGSVHRKAISSGIQHALVETFGVPQDDLPRGSRLKYPDSLQDVMAGVTLCSVIHDEEATRIRARSYPQAPSSR